MTPFDSELICVSDIHLKDPRDPKGLLLQELIETVASSKVDFFILLGDIFDFCLGSSDYFKEKFLPIGKKLTAVARSGTHVIFFEGNHEFEMQSINWPAVEFINSGDKTLNLKSGSKIKLAHGDLIYNDWKYRSFRNLVKSGFSRTVAQSLPQKWLDKFALSHAAFSRSRDYNRSLNHEKLLATVNDWLADDPNQHGLFGHFHVPYGENRPNATGAKIISFDSWDQKPNLLSYHSGQFYRCYFSNQNEFSQFEVVKGIL